MGKFATNAIGAIWWSNWNQCASGSPVAKLATVACGAIWWPNLQPIKEVLLKSIKTILVERFTHVMDSIPWVRCASGNV